MRKKKKLINSLLGFYQAIAGIYTGAPKFEDSVIRGMIIQEHLNELIVFHKGKVDRHEIPIGKVSKFYHDYIDDWNKHIISKSGYFSEIIETYIGSKCTYFS